MFRDSAAYAGFSTSDIAEAKRFYGETLGLDVSEANGMLTLHFANGGSTLIYPKDDHQPATFTVLNLPVPDVDAAVDALIAAGVAIEHYPDSGQDERGVMRQWGPPIAWFKDPAGNILSVIGSSESEG
ncbi:MAG TPA: VOC family protein [Candidatus Limnocylindria bacterium]|nr:VOC family protein [Candidatus Limnocylindria bacterium]